MSTERRVRYRGDARTCEECHREFEPKSHTQRWCETCAVVERACPTCGCVFLHLRRSPRRFCSKSCANSASAPKGAASPLHNGGLSFSNGRWVIYCRDDTQILYSRAVMAAHLGRLLDPEGIVHHANEDTADDRIDNLVLTTRAEHIRMHMPALLAARGVA